MAFRRGRQKLKETVAASGDTGVVEEESGHAYGFGAFDVDLHVVHEQALGDGEPHAVGGGRVGEGMRLPYPEGHHVDDMLEQVSEGASFGGLRLSLVDPLLTTIRSL